MNRIPLILIFLILVTVGLPLHIVVAMTVGFKEGIKNWYEEVREVIRRF